MKQSHRPISGGDELSTYPSTCTISLERRTLPDENADSTEAELRSILDEFSQADPDFHADVKILVEPCFRSRPHTHVVTTLGDAFHR
ncbi:hypothetical protein AB0E63_21855 [Kribbella sp. NPDC026596]|uniref:hypothetical protein n=1 Tax=Kribbella sp. NPDC026596 TaxID=3155122 RepID=UPI0033EA09BF